MSSATFLCKASTSYKKVEGVLSLSSKSLTWIPSAGSSSIGKSQLIIESDRLQSLFSSKEGSAKVQLKIGVLAPTSMPSIAPSALLVEDFFSFVFTAACAAADQQLFKKEISTLVATNRERGISATSGGDDGTRGEEDGEGGAGPTSMEKGKGKVTGTTTFQSIFQLRRKVLVEDPALASLHTELVRSGMIAEDEFWLGREGLIDAARADERQRAGKSGEMVDPRPEIGVGGEVTVRVTPALVREIFEEYPSVLRAYGENVPKPLDEQQFWSRYFQSKLFNRNRTTNRAVVETIRDDAIFDLYLDEEDDELEPKNLQVEHIYRLLDLAATEDDQHGITNQADYTMRAGGQRSSLPLMRRFNEHSERLLNSSLGHQAKRQRMALDPGNAGARNAYYDDIILEDLTSSSTQDRILLETRDPRKNDKATTQNGDGEESDQQSGRVKMGEEEMEDVIREMKYDFSIWEPSLGEFVVNHEAIVESMKDMTKNIREKAARSDRETHSNAFPERFLQQMTLFQTSSNEFLRQFWSAILPPPIARATTNEASIAASAEGSSSVAAVSSAGAVVPLTLAQKAAKAERMKGYLMKMEEKVALLFDEAEGLSIDLVRVEAALQPVRTAVAHAIEYFDSRTV